MEWKELPIENTDAWFIILVIILALLGAVRQSDSGAFGLLVRSFINPSLVAQQLRHERAYNRITLPILGISVLAIAGFLSQGSSVFELSIGSSFTSTLMLILLGIVGLTLVRMAIYSTFSWLFQAGGLFKEHNLSWLVHAFVLSMVLIPLSILIAFGPDAWHRALAIIGIVALIVFYFLRVWRVITMTQRELRTSWVYNVLYLCALEILPPILIGVSVLRYGEA